MWFESWFVSCAFLLAVLFTVVYISKFLLHSFKALCASLNQLRFNTVKIHFILFYYDQQQHSVCFLFSPGPALCLMLPCGSTGMCLTGEGCVSCLLSFALFYAVSCCGSGTGRSVTEPFGGGGNEQPEGKATPAAPLCTTGVMTAKM